MPRYTIGNVEIPVNQATASNAVANPAALAVIQVDKDALREAKEAKGGGGSGISGGSLLVVGGLVAAAGWYLLKHKPGARGAAAGHVIRK